MQIEIMAFWGFLCLILIGFAELQPKLRMLGFVGCLLLIPLAFWIWDSGIEIQSGQTTTITTTTNTTVSSSTGYGTDSSIFDRSPLTIPYFNIKEIMFLLLVGMSLYGSVHYAMETLSAVPSTPNYYRV
jgi:hypothetical protein